MTKYPIYISDCPFFFSSENSSEKFYDRKSIGFKLYCIHFFMNLVFFSIAAIY